MDEDGSSDPANVPKVFVVLDGVKTSPRKRTTPCSSLVCQERSGWLGVEGVREFCGFGAAVLMTVDEEAKYTVDPRERWSMSGAASSCGMGKVVLKATGDLAEMG